MSCLAKLPPVFDEENDDYEMWRRNVEIWSELTDIPVEKKALAVHMVLKGRAQMASSEISIADLKEKNGVGLKKLLEKLDGLYLHEVGRRQFSYFRDLYRLKRESSVGIDEFVSTFEHAYFKLSSKNVTLPGAVLSFMLLESCCLDHNEEQLILSGMSDINFDNMKAALKRVFGGKVGDSTKVGVKCEPTFFQDSHDSLYTKDRQNFSSSYTSRGGRWNNRRGRGGNYGYNSHRGNNNGASQSSKYSNTNNNGVNNIYRKTNPTDQEGNIMRCNVCESKFHFARNCQHSHENNSNESYNNNRKFKNNDADENENKVVQLSMLVGYTNEFGSENLSTLVKDASGCAILDSGCSTTVCGQIWFDKYVSSLSPIDSELIEIKPSNTNFTFGNGRSYQSTKCAKIPCYVAGMKADIEVDVVNCNIPLLLSKKAMKKGKMCLDFERDCVVVNGKTVKLNETTSGHYILPLQF